MNKIPKKNLWAPEIFFYFSVLVLGIYQTWISTASTNFDLAVSGLLGTQG